MNIGGVKLSSRLLAAPLAGFSDIGFRSLCARFGAGLTYTEMVSAKGMCYGNHATEALLAFQDSGLPRAVQLFGSDPEYMFRAAGDDRLKPFDIIDINMGCPMRKVISNGDGSALMSNPALITEIVSAVREGGGKPVTVKIRAGIELGKPLAVQCAEAAQRGGAAAVTVHPRYREQMYGGKADHRITREVKEAVNIPVVANGDICDARSLEEIANQSGADFFMIGRGALGRPWIFSQLCISEKGKVTEKELKDVEIDVKTLIFEHIELLRTAVPDRVAANVMKQHICWYAKNTSRAKAVRTAVSAAGNLEDIFAVIDENF